MESIGSPHEKNSDIDIWKVGFYETHKLAENGVVHGNSLLSDEDIGTVLNNSKKNQLGIDYSFNGQPVRVFIAESGYVEIYQPNNFSSMEFATYIRDQIIPNTSVE